MTKEICLAQIVIFIHCNFVKEWHVCEMCVYACANVFMFYVWGGISQASFEKENEGRTFVLTSEGAEQILDGHWENSAHNGKTLHTYRQQLDGVGCIRPAAQRQKLKVAAPCADLVVVGGHGEQLLLLFLVCCCLSIIIKITKK